MPTHRGEQVQDASLLTSLRPFDRLRVLLCWVGLILLFCLGLSHPTRGAILPGIPLGSLRLPVPVLQQLDDVQLEQAYRFGREHRTSPVEVVLPRYMVSGEHSGAWALLATPWAEAALTGWFGIGGDRLLPSDREYLHRIQPFLLVRSPETYTITLRQGDRVFAPLDESRHLGVSFAFFLLRELDVQTPIEVEFWRDEQQVDVAVWRWNELMEGARLSPAVVISDPADLPPLEWIGVAVVDGRPVGQFSFGGYRLHIALDQISLEVDPDSESLTLSLPARVTGDGADLLFRFVSVPRIE